MSNFTWRDGGRIIRFGRSAAADAPKLIEDGFTLLTTARAQGLIEGLAERADAVHLVAPGRVDDLAEAMYRDVTGKRLIALGGGRVIDVTKAIAAVNGATVGAIPTTLSGAEMTHSHRLPQSAPAGTALVRPNLIINDPALTASHEPASLAASAANALAHAIEGRVTIRTSPVPSIVGEEAARLIDIAFYGDDPADANRDKLALAALLAGYVTDANGIGLHHMLAQTLVRVGGAQHGQANAVLLPHTIGALERRTPGNVDPDGTLTSLAEKLARFAHAARIAALDVDPGKLDAMVSEAASRPALDNTPPRADEAEIRALYEAAW
ncbi:MAG TPA: iron-containing alcohol dehydrogenase [Baekduia sp.]|nr:iron-containing alcohol dehydrogenase [Baekduia sp.]